MHFTEIYCVFPSQHANAVSRRVFYRAMIRSWLVPQMFVAFALLIAAGDADGHEFEDDFVERSVAVVVRDTVARLEYSIGLNPNTKQQLMKFWQATDLARDDAESAPSKKTETATPKADFYQLAADHLSRRLNIFVNQQPIQPTLVSSLPSSRHHVDVTVILEFKLPATDSQPLTAIEINDGNFFRPGQNQQKIAPPQAKTSGGSAKSREIVPNAPHLLPAPFGGGFRHAFKTRGSTVIESSNVASILIRADRQMDCDLTDAQLELAFTIKAEVINILTTRADH